MDVLVLLRRDAAPVAMPIERLRHELDVGMIGKDTPVSTDHGASWIPGWQAAGLTAPVTPAEAAGSMVNIIPVGRSGWAIVTGYLALITMFIDLGLVALVIGAISNDRADPRDALGPALVMFVFGTPFQLITAFAARSAIKKNPNLLGNGRVIYSFVCVGLQVMLTAALVLIAVVRS
ncbi:MAG: hypothetical protein ACXWUG_22085 [Polyangiales bacterium]